MENLLCEHEKLKSRIRARLRDFRKVWRESDERIFEELAFCLCTPQSGAKSCFTAVSDLANSGMLFVGNKFIIGSQLRGYVRFHNNKSGYILEARETFSDSSGNLKIKKMLCHRDPLALREWLVGNVKGLGHKEAAHFLRNIGRGEDLAILDRHILRNMIQYKVIQQIPVTLTKRTYLDLENQLRGFSNRIGIPMAELDLLFWYRATGEIFK